MLFCPLLLKLPPHIKLNHNNKQEITQGETILIVQIMETNIEHRRSEVMVEVKKQLKLAGPLVSVYLLLFCLQIISVMFVGHLGELALASASLATSFAGVTAFSLLMGMSSALETFCGQAFGAKEYPKLGIYMQRAMLVLTLTCIPISIIIANTGKILILLRQNQELAHEAGLYARWMIPGIFASALIHCMIKFLQSQNVVVPMIFCCSLTALLHIPLCWVMVFKSGLGSKGVALANGISYWLNVIMFAMFVRFSSTCKNTWVGFSKEAFHDLHKFFKLAIPSALMICLEYWSFEGLVLLSGLLPDPQLETSVLSISLNTSTMAFMIVMSLGAVVSIRVSNELGAGHPKAAKLAIQVTLTLAVTESIMIGLCIILVRNIWGKLYSNVGSVVSHVAAMMPLLAASSILDAFQCVLSGTARGCGKQKIGAFVNLGAYYIVGIPFGVVFAFVLHFKGKGLWLGIICALSVQVLLLTVIVICTDWEKEVNKAKERVSNMVIPTNTTSRSDGVEG